MVWGVSDSVLRQAIQSEKDSLGQVYKVSWQNPQVAREIRAVFHHALLAANDDQRFLILSLTDEEIEMLEEELGLAVESALEYRHRRDTQLTEAYNKLDQKLLFRTSSAATIGGINPVSPVAAASVTGIPGYPCYPTVEETFSVANDLAASYPTLAEMIDIGDSWEKVDSSGATGYDLWVMKITNSATDGAFPDKPRLFIHSAMHAREYATAALTLDFARKLLQEYASDADIEWIVNYHEIHILFHMNPDGRKIAEAGVLKRKNNNINACGMTGFNNFGVDLNRNFSFFWARRESEYDYSGAYRVSDDECNETYRGPYPGSEPETQAVEAYIRGLYADSRGSNDTDPAPSDKPGLHLDIHSFGNLLLFPFAHTFDPAPNGNALQRLARRLAFFNNYVPQQSPYLYLLDGNSESVSYGELGVAQLTFELGGEFFEACSQYSEIVKPDNLRALTHAAKVAAAPYRLPAGPYFEEFLIKGREQPDITAGADILVSALVTDTLFNELYGVEPAENIAMVEYSIERHFYEPLAVPVVLDPVETVSDSVFDSPEETIAFRLDNSNGEYPLGRHTIYLRATDSAGDTGAVAARHFNVIASSYLEANLQYSCEYNVCSFDATGSIDTDGDIARYHWDFGDGNTSTKINPTHYYRANGNFQVTLTVEGEDAEIDTQTINYTVSLSGSPPDPALNYTCTELDCSFDGSSSSDPDGDIHVRRWKFGDGSVRGGATVSHSYAMSGRYEVTFLVVDTAGWRIATTFLVDVQAPSTTTTIAGSTSGQSQPASNGASAMTVQELILLFVLLARRAYLKFVANPHGLIGRKRKRYVRGVK